MKRIERPPPIDSAPAGLFERGHLWIQEAVDGGRLQFRMSATGEVEFGTETREFDPQDVPPAHRHAVRHVRERLDREALMAAVEDPATVVFAGVATYRRRLDYDWRRLPGFLGTDVWSGSREAFLPPDATEQAFERLGLVPVNAIEKEVPAAHFDPREYDFPGSAWYDGPALGVVFRDKTGGRARRLNPAVADAEVGPDDGSASIDPESLADEYATARRFERVARELETRGRAVTFDALRDRVFEEVLREAYPTLFQGAATVDLAGLRRAIGERTGTYLG